MRTAAVSLGMIGLAYLVRESMNVLRRFLVERTCTRINKDMCVRLDRPPDEGGPARSWPRIRSGPCTGGSPASVDGFVRFLRISFLDFVPALLTGAFALAATLSKQPRVALAMVGRGPHLAGADDLAAHHAEGDPPRPDADPRGDGRHGRRAALGHRLRPGGQHASRRRSAASPGRPSGSDPRSCGTTSRCRCSAAARRSTRGSSTSSSSPSPSTCFVQGRIRLGDIITFSVLLPERDGPLNEVHRFIDEAHESSLRVGDLIELADESRSTGRSSAGRRRSSRASAPGEPMFVAEDLEVDVPDGRRQAQAGARRRHDDHPPRRDDRRGRPVGLRQDDLAPRPDAARPPHRRDRDARRRPARVGHAARRSASWSATSARTRSSSPARSPQNIAYGCDEAPPTSRSAAPPRWRASTTRS